MSEEFSHLRDGINLHEFINETFGLNQAISRALSGTIVNLMMLEKEVKELRKTVRAYEKRPRCCGKIAWPKAAPHYGKRMYVHHGLGKSCPLHGEPPNGGRIRKYIREDDQQLIRDSIDNWHQWQAAIRELEEVQEKLKDFQKRVLTLGFGF